MPRKRAHRAPEGPRGWHIEASGNQTESDRTAVTSEPRRWFVLAIATGGGAGFVPWAPGTMGSAVGVLVYLGLAPLGFPLYLLTTIAITVLGIWAADASERILGRKDDGRIVIDEVAGQLFTLAPLMLLAPVEEIRSPLWLVTGFVAFRLLDIWKPGPIRWAEQHFSGGAGVVLDDVAAGLIAAVAMSTALWIAT